MMTNPHTLRPRRGDRPRWHRIWVLLVVLAMVAAACGGGDDASDAPASDDDAGGSAADATDDAADAADDAAADDAAEDDAADDDAGDGDAADGGTDAAAAGGERPWLDWDLGGTLINVGFGGSFSDAEYEHVWDPFTELTGVTVEEVPWTADIYEQVRVQVEADRVEIDQYAVFAGNYDLYADCCLEEIDYSIFPQETLDTMRDEHKLTHAIAYAEVPVVLAYSTEAFPPGEEPQDWADFWDVEAFPGGRSLLGFEPMHVLEAALLADGVAREDMYPLDFDRAFEKLEEIRPHVVQWWQSGTDAQNLLTSGEVTMIMMTNSRIEDLIDQDFPVWYTLNEALTKSDYLAVPRGAPNRDASMASIAFRFEPEIGAAIGEAWRQPIPSTAVFDAADPELASRWPTATVDVPELGGVPNDIVFRIDSFYWYETNEDDPDGRTNYDVMNERFQEFIAR